MPIWGANPDPNSVGPAELQSAAVTNPKLAADSVSSSKIGSKEVKTADIDDAAITVTQLANDAVETAKIKDANITAAKFAAGAVKYQTIQDTGSDKTQRSKLNFVGATVADDSGNDRTTVTISGGTDTDYYQTVQDAGSDKTQRDKLNFVGATITDSSSPSRTNVDVTPADASITTAKLAAGAVTVAPVRVDAAASNITLTGSDQTILTSGAITPASTGSVFRFTYVAKILQDAAADENYICTLTKNVSGGGDTTIKSVSLGATPALSTKYVRLAVFTWIETGLATSSTVFKIKEKLSPTATSSGSNLGAQQQAYLFIEEILR